MSVPKNASPNPFLNNCGTNRVPYPEPEVELKKEYRKKEYAPVDTINTANLGCSLTPSSENFVDMVADRIACLNMSIYKMESLRETLAPMQPTCGEDCCKKEGSLRASFDGIWDNLPQTLGGFTSRIDSIFYFIGSIVYKYTECGEKVCDKKALDNHVARVRESLNGLFYSLNRMDNLSKMLSGESVEENCQGTTLSQEASFTTVWKALPELLNLANDLVVKAHEEIIQLFLGVNMGNKQPEKC